MAEIWRRLLRCWRRMKTRRIDGGSDMEEATEMLEEEEEGHSHCVAPHLH